MRLAAQRLAGNPLQEPEAVVRRLGVLQAQDYHGAKWALAQRTADSSEALLDALFGEGRFLRTHLLRPTWHFVAPEEIRWMVELGAPNLKRAMAPYYRRLELDDRLFKRTNDVIAKALAGGNQLTRAELGERLTRLKIDLSDPMRLGLIVEQAEVDGLICSGALRGKQHTYALLAERAPAAKSLPRAEAAALLAKRFFTGHGPATLRDFSWWSGLSSTEAKTALEAVKGELESASLDDQLYWFENPPPRGDDGGQPSAKGRSRDRAPLLHLLPNYDEYIVAYADRSAVIDPAVVKQVDARNNILFNHAVVATGAICGAWKRELSKREVSVTATLFRALSAAERRALNASTERYGRFLELKAALATNGDSAR